jgi:hypothetical protein
MKIGRTVSRFPLLDKSGNNGLNSWNLYDSFSTSKWFTTDKSLKPLSKKAVRVLPHLEVSDSTFQVGAWERKSSLY